MTEHLAEQLDQVDACVRAAYDRVIARLDCCRLSQRDVDEFNLLHREAQKARTDLLN